MSGRNGKRMIWLAALALAGTAAGTSAAEPDRTVSVMTYNVHGVPWPVADDRSAALSAIAAQLRSMRAAGRPNRWKRARR